MASFPGLETGSSSIRRISSRSSSGLAIKLVYKQQTITEIKFFRKLASLRESDDVAKLRIKDLFTSYFCLDARMPRISFDGQGSSLLYFLLPFCHPDNPVWESCISLHEPS
jgi:hypothetical protein